MTGPKKPSNPLNQDDAALIKAFQAGDKHAFDDLVIRHKDNIFNLCYRFLGDYEEANDCAQETFIKAYQSLKKFRFGSSFSTWLFRIGVNTCKNRLKSLDYRFKKKTRRLDNPDMANGGNPSIQIADESPSPMIKLEKKERSILIQKAIDSLPKAKKTMIVLRDIEGLPYNEIAEITRFNLGTVKSRLARARSDLRKKLRGVI
ncbi:MAG: sigma-70 family RNA polymerase sigma factor [Desulfobacterales bacterium]|nr:sigma-70 family RNA polymerase sigma factor [Desulfobacterales bacterium]